MKRSSRFSSHLVLAVLIVLPGPLAPATIVVDGADSVVADDGVCTLAEAIPSANNNSPSGKSPGECIAGDDLPLGGDSVVLTNDVMLTEALTAVSGQLTIFGNDFTIARDPDAPRFPVIRAALVQETDHLDVRNTTITGGSASNGGGLFTFGSGRLSLSNSTLVGNYAVRDGGGVYAFSFSGPVELTNTTISGNTAGSNGGGGVFIGDYGSLKATNTTISGNSAGDRGGGVYVRNSVEAKLMNSTLVANTAGNEGSATHVHLSASLRARGTIFAGNLGGDSCSFELFARLTTAPESTDDAGGDTNFSDDSSCGDNLIIPGLDIRIALEDNGGPTKTHALVSGSVAIDAAEDCGLGTDQRGFARDALCDSGSYEFGGAPPPTLELNGSCPGEITATVSSASPNSSVALVRGLQPGANVLEVGACAGTELALADPQIATVATTDGNGAVSVLVNVPDGFCGVFLQAVDGTLCSVSNLATLPGSG